MDLQGALLQGAYKRIEELEKKVHDVQVENARLSADFEKVEKSCNKLVAKVNEFVGRFAVVQ